MEIIKENYIPETKVKKILERREKETEELVYEQRNTLDYLKTHVKLSDSDADKLMKDLSSIEDLREDHTVAIVNLLPKDRDDLRVILTKDRFSLSEDQVNKILEIVAKYL